MTSLRNAVLTAMLALTSAPAWADPGAYLEITLKIEDTNRAAAAAVYTQYKEPFLTTIPGAEQKILLIRAEDVQVLHGFDTRASAEAYLSSALFTQDVVAALSPYLTADPEVRIYDAP